jgi:hypothetical protein
MPVGLTHSHQSGDSPTRVPLVTVLLSAQHTAVARLSYCTAQLHTICFALPHKTFEYGATVLIPPSSLVSAVLRNNAALHIAQIINLSSESTITCDVLP